MGAPYYQDDTVQLFHGDCLDVLAELPGASVDAVVTDPPYGLEFMGKEWDSFRQANRGPQDMAFKDFGNMPTFSPNRRNQKCPDCQKWAYDHVGRKCECGGWKQPAQKAYTHAFGDWCQLWAAECLRVLKPGGHLLAFGGTRTWHRLACAVEDAGFEIRDSIAWLYGSGFPKSLDVSKAIDKLAGVEPVIVGPDEYRRARANRGTTSEIQPSYDKPRLAQAEANITAPATDAARRWSGWGTALKPAFEPIVVARKPLQGKVAANVLEYGTGGLNIDGCRIAHGTDVNLSRQQRQTADTSGLRGLRDSGFKSDHVQSLYAEGGRWPANVILDEDQAAALDEQSGALISGGRAWAAGDTDTDSWRRMEGRTGPATRGEYSRAGDVGGASRFFYTSKADQGERITHNGVAHPTVKPLDLMRWLVRLVTPPGGLILEPFAGSGTTVEAAVLEGFRCVAIEREADYLPLITQRIHRRRDPVKYLTAAGDDLGLFADEDVS